MNTPARRSPPEDLASYEQISQSIESLPSNILSTEKEQSPSLKAGSLAFLRVFRHRNYRLFFSGQLISLMGTWITLVTQGWLTYSLTGSQFLLGVVAFAGQAPVFFFSAFAVAISDRYDSRRVLILTQFLAMTQSAVLAALALTGTIKVWHIIGLALFQGCINALDIPIRQSMITEMVGRQDVRLAISLNSMLFNFARIVGPMVAGFLIAILGPGICFLVDSLSYAAVLTSLTLMHFQRQPVLGHLGALHALKQGLIYAWRVREIRVLLILISLCSAFGASYLTLLPAIARDVLHQKSQGLGLLYSAVGAGALLGAFALGQIADRYLLLIPTMAALSFGLALIAFSQSHVLWLSLLLLTPCSFSSMLLGGAANSIIQILSRDDMRGRVMAIYAMGFMGLLPWGSLVLGVSAQRFGSVPVVAAGGLICALAAIGMFFYQRGQSRLLVIPE